jgi:hypothetical protein
MGKGGEGRFEVANLKAFYGGLIDPFSERVQREVKRGNWGESRQTIVRMYRKKRQR